MKRFFIFSIVLLTVRIANAQELLKGNITEVGTHEKLTNVFIRDNANKQITLAGKDGSFAIKTEPGHLLIFDSPGYLGDTLYVIDMKPKNIELRPISIALRQVNINSSKAAFDPHAEYPEVYTKSKVYVLSPSTWFSKEGKDARRLRRFFNTEEQERHVDEVFTVAYVGSIVPLKGVELENFMALYRPTYAFIHNNNGPSMAAYINDSYKKYKALPPDKRKLDNLVGQ